MHLTAAPAPRRYTGGQQYMLREARMAAEHLELHVSRRRFVQGAGVAGLGLLAGCGLLPGQAPAPKVPRVGVLTNILTSSSPWLEAFRQGLREHGWTPGENVMLEYRSAEGDTDRITALATELIGLPVDVIMTGGPDAARAVKQATSTIPIVMGSTTDAVEEGLVASLAQPGGNVTGLSQMRGQLAGKRLQLLTEVVPRLSRVAVVWVSNQDHSREAPALEVASRDLGLEVYLRQVTARGDAESAIDGLVQEQAGAAVIMGPSEAAQPLFAAARQRGLSTISERREAVVAGALMAYGPNAPDQYRRAATYVDRILRGARPADLPVEQPMVFDFVINLQTAQALGLTIPQHVLLQATEVIQ
jgi:putative ABC transport system substrate-binding protein